MKWISELKRSVRIDSRPMGTATAQGKAQSQNGTQDLFEKVHERLALEKPAALTSETLHESIMMAVRSEEAQVTGAESGSRRHFAFWPRFAAVSGMIATLMLAGILLLTHRPGPRSPSADLQQQIMSLPGKAVSPLSKELESLQEDLQTTTAFLMASVPEIDN